MNLITHFNYRLAICAAKGYPKAVSFNGDPRRLGTVPLYSSVGSDRRGSEGRTAPAPKKKQIQRTNRALASTPSPFFPTWGES